MSGNLRRAEPNRRRWRSWPRCPDCGARCPTAQLLRRHRERDCCGLTGGPKQLNLDDALAAHLEGFADWDVFAEVEAS
jgi:hypothetical protein